jgi:hypothetical protein
MHAVRSSAAILKILTPYAYGTPNSRRNDVCPTKMAVEETE